MTDVEKAKQKKINDITLVPFKIAFPYKEFFWSVNSKSVDAWIDNVFKLDDCHVILGRIERIRIKKNFDWNDVEKIGKMKELFEAQLKKHKLLQKYKNYIDQHQNEFDQIIEYRK